MRANDVVVVLGGIIQFVVGAGTLKIDLVNQVQAIQQSNHAKDGRIIRAASLGGGEFLDLLQRKRSSRPEEGVNDIAPSSGNAEAFSTEPVQDGLRGERLNASRSWKTFKAAAT